MRTQIDAQVFFLLEVGEGVDQNLLEEEVEVEKLV
jgi:hypothetical protein